MKHFGISMALKYPSKTISSTTPVKSIVDREKMRKYIPTVRK